MKSMLDKDVEMSWMEKAVGLLYDRGCHLGMEYLKLVLANLYKHYR